MDEQEFWDRAALSFLRAQNRDSTPHSAALAAAQAASLLTVRRQARIAAEDARDTDPAPAQSLSDALLEEGERRRRPTRKMPSVGARALTNEERDVLEQEKLHDQQLR